MTDHPKRIQLRRQKGWRKPPGAVVVSRPTRWGNPYALQRRDDYEGLVLVVDTRDGTIEDHAVHEAAAREIAVGMFRGALIDDRCITTARGSVAFTVADVRRELAGKDLACWCPLPQPGEPDLCHAAILLEIANGAAVPVRTETRRVFVAERTVYQETRDCDGDITDVALATQRRTFLSEHAAWLWVARGALFVRRAEKCGGRCGEPRPPDGEPDWCRYCDEKRWRPLVARYARMLRRRAKADP